MTSSHGLTAGASSLSLEDDISGSIHSRAYARGFLESVIRDLDRLQNPTLLLFLLT